VQVSDLYTMLKALIGAASNTLMSIKI